jgi:predicted RNase H-like HicB family nuclease
MKDEHLNEFYSDDDLGCIADIPDLPHCSAFGTTPEEALREVLQAKQAWLKVAHAAAHTGTALSSDRSSRHLNALSAMM